MKFKPTFLLIVLVSTGFSGISPSGEPQKKQTRAWQVRTIKCETRLEKPKCEARLYRDIEGEVTAWTTNLDIVSMLRWAYETKNEMPLRILTNDNQIETATLERVFDGYDYIIQEAAVGESMYRIVSIDSPGYSDQPGFRAYAANWPRSATAKGTASFLFTESPMIAEVLETAFSTNAPVKLWIGSKGIVLRAWLEGH